jgi:hypothetical protein
MKKAEIVIVHGVGPHQSNWSASLQGHLAQQFNRLGASCTCREAIYTDIVEKGATLEAASEDPEDLQDEQVIQTDMARVDASIEAALGPEVVAQVETQSILGPSIRENLRNVNHYAIRYLRQRKLRAAINNRVLEAIAPAADTALAAGKDGCLILIGHSLGSVIIWNLTADQKSYLSGRVSRLVTLASPLGWLKFARVVEPQTVRTRWVAVGTPGDVVCHKSIYDPPFGTVYGLVSVWTRRFDDNPHSGLLNDSEVISDWAPLLV